MTKIVVLSGGVGGARFTRGLLALSDRIPPRGNAIDVTVIANTGDDMWLNGLRICPDLDTIMYTLGGGINDEQGWGRIEETRRTSDEIRAYGRGWDWFTLGDLDLATHIVRTDLLHEGASLSEVTSYLCQRWNPGVALLPMSDQPAETHVRLAKQADEHAAGDLIHFEEWWVRYRATIAVSSFVQVGIESAKPAPGVIQAILNADAIIIPPSNPVVSIGTILAIPGIREALQATSAKIVGVSPIIAGSTLRGMAAQCLAVIGTDASASAVATLYGARSHGGILDGFLLDPADAAELTKLSEAGIPARSVPLIMADTAATADIAASALALAGVQISAAPPTTFNFPAHSAAASGALADGVKP
ncbi:LPPG:FO 2-phospho-L-lactate transferase [Paenarthrobacter nicotinovorans]|uniref:2-phospho-L-lactate transferase n=1 Tax=Paenarthrobacter nicotinovorans TaxID=29320 RepID=UPI0027873AF4|nr:2-phospho-L-lactate transferase [Paenarthrobacter nicotinovorans]MDP9933765.1 LPPG:FO 2-phospho-L-lactate transferase [Paenarthrobacter nicotinovorans]